MPWTRSGSGTANTSSVGRLGWCARPQLWSGGRPSSSTRAGGRSRDRCPGRARCSASRRSSFSAALARSIWSMRSPHAATGSSARRGGTGARSAPRACERRRPASRSGWTSAAQPGVGHGHDRPVVTRRGHVLERLACGRAAGRGRIRSGSSPSSSPARRARLRPIVAACGIAELADHLHDPLRLVSQRLVDAVVEARALHLGVAVGDVHEHGTGLVDSARRPRARAPPGRSTRRCAPVAPAGRWRRTRPRGRPSCPAWRRPRRDCTPALPYFQHALCTRAADRRSPASRPARQRRHTAAWPRSPIRAGRGAAAAGAASGGRASPGRARWRPPPGDVRADHGPGAHAGARTSAPSARRARGGGHARRSRPAPTWPCSLAGAPAHPGAGGALALHLALALCRRAARLGRSTAPSRPPWPGSTTPSPGCSSSSRRSPPPEAPHPSAVHAGARARLPLGRAPPLAA